MGGNLLNNFITDAQTILDRIGDESLKHQQKILSTLIRDVRNFIEQHPNNAELYFQLGTAIKAIPFATDGQYELMETAFEAASKLKKEKK